MSVISIRDLGFAFESQRIFEGLSFELSRGEVLAIVGKSGSGKTTLLDLISGHRAPSRGTIDRSGPVLRVYQKDGLLPWLTVRQNIEMGSSDPATVDGLLQLTGLADHAAHFPSQISGGMRQKTELARVLAAGADALLLDEAWSSLDYGSRVKLRNETLRMLAPRSPGILLVTHDLEEAALLADRILVLEGSPAQIVESISIRAPRPRRPGEPEMVAAVESLQKRMGIA